MDKRRWFLAQTLAKGLVLLLGLPLFLDKGPRAFAQDNDPFVLAQQIAKLSQEGKYGEAIPIAEKLLSIDKRFFGPEHRETADDLNNLAFIYYLINDYAKAEPLYQQAIQIRENAREGTPRYPYKSQQPGGSLFENG